MTTERICLTRRSDDPEKIDFSEFALRSLDTLNLTHYGTASLVDAASKEVTRLAKEYAATHHVDFEKACMAISEVRPRLFKLSRLEATDNPARADVVAEELRG